MNNNEIQELMEEVQEEIEEAEREENRSTAKREMLMEKLLKDHKVKTIKIAKKKTEKKEEELITNRSLFTENLKKFKEKYEVLGN